MRGRQWMSWQTPLGDDMEINEALIKLEAHEKECLVRYQNIQDTLNKHHDRFDKLEEKAQHGFDKIESHIIRGIGFLSFLMTAILGLAEYLR